MDTLDIVIVLITIWTIPWKIYGVWTAVKLDHKRWFVALLILNTFSILELIYIFYILKKTGAEVKADFKAGWIALKGGLKKKEETPSVESGL